MFSRLVFTSLTSALTGLPSAASISHYFTAQPMKRANAWTLLHRTNLPGGRLADGVRC